MLQSDHIFLFFFTMVWEVKSKYFVGLTEQKDRDLYEKKLTLKNGTLLSDPYGLQNNEWSDDVKKLPDVTYFDIVNYLIDTPSEFTKDKLKAYKSLEAYNFFVSGHVQEVYIHEIKETDFSHVKSSVLPSQRQGQKQTLYDVWVTLHKSGWVLCANCTCMAGLVFYFSVNFFLNNKVFHPYFTPI